MATAKAFVISLFFECPCGALLTRVVKRKRSGTFSIFGGDKIPKTIRCYVCEKTIKIPKRIQPHDLTEAME